MILFNSRICVSEWPIGDNCPWRSLRSADVFLKCIHKYAFAYIHIHLCSNTCKHIFSGLLFFPFSLFLSVYTVSHECIPILTYMFFNGISWVSCMWECIWLQDLTKNDGIELILNNNSFQFDNKNYIQTQGTAIGTKMVPMYTTLILAYLKENLYQGIGKKYNNSTKTKFIRSWKRYLDHCFALWMCSWGRINVLHNLFQNLHPKMKFTIEHNFKELAFLDILIKNQNG